jgi:hypothetical protein
VNGHNGEDSREAANGLSREEFVKECLQMSGGQGGRGRRVEGF